MFTINNDHLSTATSWFKIKRLQQLGNAIKRFVPGGYFPTLIN